MISDMLLAEERKAKTVVNAQVNMETEMAIWSLILMNQVKDKEEDCWPSRSSLVSLMRT